MFSDQPIKNSSNDLFGRKNFANRIAQIIAGRTDKESIAIGIHAPWGEGKTSVLNMIVEGLEAHLHRENKTIDNGNIVLLKFNPWRFGDENQLLESFYFALANKLNGRIKTKGENITDLIKKLAWVTSPFDGLKFGTFGLDANLKVEETLKKVAEEKSKVDINTLKERIEKILEESDKKIIVIMDDIDRLEKEEIQAVFRLIKLSADFPNTIYLLSFDVDRVSEALAEKYSSKEAGRSFLEKIIQLSLPLPPITADKLIDLAFDEINKLLAENNIVPDERKDTEWSYFFRKTFGYYLKSPRLVKKYINNLWFSMAYTKNELNIFDLQTIEAVHAFFPDLYESIRSNKNVFLMEPLNPWHSEKENKENIEKLKAIINNFPDQERETIKDILRNLFPKSISAFSNSSYGSGYYEIWSKEKKIASPKYFHRYFNIGISSDDISDVELNYFIENLSSNSEAKNISEMEELVSKNREKLFLLKLSWLVDSLEKETIIKLAEVIAKSGNLFSIGNIDSFGFRRNPFANAAGLLGQLLETIKDENEQIAIAVNITSRASSLDFAGEFFRFAQNIGKETSQQNKELTDLGKAVRKKLVERIEKEIQEQVLEVTYPNHFGYLYFAWLLENPTSVKNYLAKRINQDPQNAIKFILSFAQINWGVNELARFWGFDFIVNAIEKSEPNLELPLIENYSEDLQFPIASKEQYLAYFVAIAKKFQI